jgi:hypothetical protein
MLPNEGVALFYRHVWETQLHISFHDRAAFARNVATSPAYISSNAQSQLVRKPADDA